MSEEKDYECACKCDARTGKCECITPCSMHFLLESKKLVSQGSDNEILLQARK